MQSNLAVSPLTGTACAPVGPGTLYPNTEVEPWLVVNPANARNVVGTWQQDRYSGGAARASSTGVSMDGGKTFTQVTIPGPTKRSGGTVFEGQAIRGSRNSKGDYAGITTAGARPAAPRSHACAFRPMSPTW